MRKFAVPKKEELYHLYIELGYSIKQLEVFYGCSAKPIKKWLKMYSITKSKEQRLQAAEKACMEKYGSSYPFGSESVQQKVKTTLDKYYNDSTWVEHMQKKRVSTLRKRYGVDNVGQLESTKKKSEETSLRKWGVSHYTKTAEYKDRAQQTNFARLGVLYPMQSEEVRAKAKKTVKLRYKVDNVAQSEDTQKKMRATSTERYGVPSYAQTEEFKSRVSATNLKKYGVPYGCMTKKCRESSGYAISKVNLWWKDFLNAEDTEFAVNGFSYDLKIGNTLVEINPTYTHNSTVGPFFNGKRKEPTHKDYHKNKFLAAKSAGFSCLCIWDWDNPDVVKDMLLPNKISLSAAECSIKVISNEDAISFLNTNHIHKAPRQMSLNIGLYFQDSLIAIMSFNELNGEYQYELSRFCFKLGYNVKEGAKRLFEHFLELKRPKNVVFYCDISKLSGDVYKDIGFCLVDTLGPCVHWHNGKKHIVDYSFDLNKHTRDSLGADFVAIYDCGLEKWVYSN